MEVVPRMMLLFFLAIWCVNCYKGAGEGFIIKHYSGLCLAINNRTKQAYLKRFCNERFVWTAGSSIMHVDTMLCLVPKSSKDDAEIIAKKTCNSSFAQFAVTRNRSLRHVATNKCIHPFWGCPVPQQDDKVVLHGQCNEERLKFHLMANDSTCEPLYPYCDAKSKKVAKSSTNCNQKGLDWHWVYIMITIGSSIILGQLIFILCTYRRIVKRLKNRDETGRITFGKSRVDDSVAGNKTRDVHVISMISTEHDDEFSDSSTSTIDKHEPTQGSSKKEERPYINVDYNQNKNKKDSRKRKKSKDRTSKRLSKLSIDVSKMRHLFKIRKSYTLNDLEMLKRISIEQHEYEEPLSPVAITAQPMGKKSKADVCGESSGYIEPDTKYIIGRSVSVPAKFPQPTSSDGYLKPVSSERDRKRSLGSNVAYVNVKPSFPSRTEKNLYDMPQMALIEEDAKECLEVEAHTYLKILDG